MGFLIGAGVDFEVTGAAGLRGNAALGSVAERLAMGAEGTLAIGFPLPPTGAVLGARTGLIPGT